MPKTKYTRTGSRRSITLSDQELAVVNAISERLCIPQATLLNWCVGLGLRDMAKTLAAELTMEDVNSADNGPSN